MPSLQELATKINSNPENVVALLEEYIKEEGFSSEEEQVRVLLNQLQRIQKTFVGIKTYLQSEAKADFILRELHMASASLDTSVYSFGQLLNNLQSNG